MAVNPVSGVCATRFFVQAQPQTVLLHNPISSAPARPAPLKVWSQPD